MRERQEEQEKDVEEEKDCSSSKSSNSVSNEWNSEQASGRMLEEGPSHVTALKKFHKIKQQFD